MEQVADQDVAELGTTQTPRSIEMRQLTHLARAMLVARVCRMKRNVCMYLARGVLEMRRVCHMKRNVRRYLERGVLEIHEA